MRPEVSRLRVVVGEGVHSQSCAIGADPVLLAGRWPVPVPAATLVRPLIWIGLVSLEARDCVSQRRRSYSSWRRPPAFYGSKRKNMCLVSLSSVFVFVLFCFFYLFLFKLDKI